MISRINHYFRLSSILVVLFLISCDKNENILLSPTEKAIAATWVYEGFDNGIYEYRRASRLAEDREGWIFHANGKLTDRKNSGFCGTPPITYENYKGNWEVGNDSRVQVKSKSWAGDVNYKLEIVSVSTNRLFVKITY